MTPEQQQLLITKKKIEFYTKSAILFITSGLFGGFLFPYVINTWLDFAGKPENHIHYYQGFLLGLIPYVGQSSPALALITWLIFLFI